MLFFPLSFRKTSGNLGVNSSLTGVKQQKYLRVSAQIFRKEHFFHDAFLMAAVGVAGSFGAACNCDVHHSQVPRESRKPGIEKSRQENKVFMKKILFISLVLLSLNSLRAQSVPQPIVQFGLDYQNTYVELVDKLTQVEKGLYIKRGYFGTVDDLVSYSCSEWSRLSNSNCQVNTTSIVKNLIQIETGGVNYTSIIEKADLSDGVKKKLLSINNAIQGIENEGDFENLFNAQVTALGREDFSSDDKERVKMYLTSLYANYTVLMNSSFVKMGGETGRGIWGWIKSAVKCALGTAGGALVGGVGGAAVGTVTLPIVGTVSGSAVGFWGGAMAGASQSCF